MNEYYSDPVYRDLDDHITDLKKERTKLWRTSQAIRKIFRETYLTEHDMLEAIKFVMYLEMKSEQFHSIEEENWIKEYENA